ADETICEISTDKIDTELPAPVTGVVAEILVPVDSTVSVGEVLARVAPDNLDRHDGAAGSDDPAPKSGVAAGNGAVTRRPERHRYSPVVQRIAAERGIDLSQVPGSGRGGRVRKQDVLAFAESATEPPLHIETPYRPEPVAH